MNTEEIEETLVARAKDKVNDQLHVEAFPDDPINYKLLHAEGAVLVRYQGGPFGDPETYNIIVQQRTINFDLQLFVKNLRGHSGAYKYLDVLRKGFTGYRIEGLGKTYVTNEALLFYKEDEGIWAYEMNVSIKIKHEQEVSI
jgi:hypothetical protein